MEALYSESDAEEDDAKAMDVSALIGPTPAVPIVKPAEAKPEQQYNLPKRWLYCPPMGRVICNTFIPMKTPLDARIYDRKIQQPWLCFHLSHLLEHHSEGRRVGMVVDLNMAYHFYNGEKEVTERGLIYEKMRRRAECPWLHAPLHPQSQPISQGEWLDGRECL